MKRNARLYIEKLPEGLYLATSEDIPGLAVRGRTITEAMEIARDQAGSMTETNTGKNRPRRVSFYEIRIPGI